MASSNLASTCTLAWVWTQPRGRLYRQSALSCQPGGRWQTSVDACTSGARGCVPGRPCPQRCPSRRRLLRRPGRLPPAWLGLRRVSGRAPAFVRSAQPARRLWTGRPRMAACPPAAASASEVMRSRTHTVNPWFHGHCVPSLAPTTPGHACSNTRASPACQKQTSAWPGRAAAGCGPAAAWHPRTQAARPRPHPACRRAAARPPPPGCPSQPPARRRRAPSLPVSRAFKFRKSTAAQGS